MLRMFWGDRRGVAAIEYVMVACLVSLAIVAGATAIGVKVQTRYFQPAAAGLS